MTSLNKVGNSQSHSCVSKHQCKISYALTAPIGNLQLCLNVDRTDAELACEHVPEKEAVGGGSVVVSLSRMG